LGADTSGPPAAVTTRDLNTNQKRAAMMEASGQFKRKEIAQLLGVNESTVAMWRRLPSYRAQIDHYIDRDAHDVSLFVKQLRSEIVEGALLAIDRLREALTATTEKGTPNWNVQLRAAELLLSRAVSEVPHVGGEGIPGGGQATIKLVVEEGKHVSVKPPDEVIALPPGAVKEH
jgi:hypothetical protein